MKLFQQQFLDFILRANVLTFGDFTLKSGRKSPYFFNAGLFHTGHAITEAGHCYASALVEHDLRPDVLFGPAYKGIPLAVAASTALFRDFNRDIPFSYNRKEAKDHGEGGLLVGAPIKGKKVLIVDDVITAGTAIYEAVDIITRAGGRPEGVLIALDRQERGKTAGKSSIQEVQENLGIPVHSILKLEHIIEHLRKGKDGALLKRIEDYRKEYGV